MSNKDVWAATAYDILVEVAGRYHRQRAATMTFRRDNPNSHQELDCPDCNMTVPAMGV